MRNIVTIILIVFCFAAKANDSIVDSYKRITAFTSLKEAKADSLEVVKLVLKRKKYNEIPAEIFTFTNLEYLDLSKNKISEIPEGIEKLTKLKVLILSKNEFEDVPEVIYNLKSLQVLKMGRNQISSISPKIEQLENLELLDLWDNNIVDFPSEISNLKNLKVLDIRAILMNDAEQEAIRKLLPEVRVLMDVSCKCG